jgi:hypothetical protein
MEIHKSRASHHIFKGEADGRAAAEWLNRNGRTKEGYAVVKLIKNIRDLTPDIPTSLFRALVHEDSSHGQYVAGLNRVNQRLVKYAMWPMIVRRSTEVRKWGKNRPAEARTKFHWRWSHGYNQDTPTVHCIARLGEQGLFFRLRQCPLCGKWYYARFDHQLYCSNRCREKRFKSTPEWRALRREYMRKRRKERRDEGAKKISLVKRSGTYRQRG